MGPLEKSTLRWDGFLANTRNAYRDLRGNEEFTDLTLVGGDGKHVKAHQVIMAGGSSFIRKILIENPHPHPLIYLKDVNYEHLLSILDFVYTGEANIIDDHLNEFLDIAEDLKVKGLTLEKSVDEQPKSHPTTPASLQDGKAQELGSSPKVWHPRNPISSQDPKATDDRAPAPDVSHLRNVMSSASQGAAHTEVNPPTPEVPHLRSVMSAASQGPAATEVHPPRPKVSHPRSVMSAASQGPSATEVNPPTPEVSRSTPHHGHVATEGRAWHLRSVRFAPQGRAATQERSTTNHHSVTSSSNSNKLPQYSGNQDDHYDAGYIKVEVGDPSDYDVYYGVNKQGESYISDISQRVDKTGGAANGESLLSTEQQITEINNEQSVHDWYKQSDENVTIMAQDEDDYFQVKSEVVDRAFENEELDHNSFDDIMPDEEQDLFEKKSHTAENPFQCLVCFKVLLTAGSLKQHKRVHTGETPYRCPRCPKSFSQKSNLDKHIRVHTGEKPYRCPRCPKSCSQKGDLDKHIRVHTGEKPYQCPRCPKTFSRKDTLDKHIGVHRKKNCSM